MNCIVAFDEQRGIGKNGSIPWKIPEDLKHFAHVTKGRKKGAGKNVLIMGRVTWDSLPEKFKPLPDRVNIIITKNTTSYTKELVEESDAELNVWFLPSIEEATRVCRESFPTSQVFVIGGQEIYEKCLPLCNRIYVTRVFSTFDCDRFFPPFEHEFKKMQMGRRLLCSSNATATWEIWERNTSVGTDEKNETSENREEQAYLDLLKNILDNGVERPDRTKIGTYSLFCPDYLRFNVSECIPLLTTKKMPWKTVIRELLWFLRGDTDAKNLQKEGVHIWDGNSSREFLDKSGLENYPEGVLGPIYSHQWRRFGAPYNAKFPAGKQNEEGFDQIEYIVEKLKSDPFCRRLVVSAWNPADLDKMALPPCHLLFEFYVTPPRVEGDRNKLSLRFMMRSCDVFLGLPFNIFSYAVLLRIIAMKVYMDPFELIVTLGDAHLYKNHKEQAGTQMSREPFPFPKLAISDHVATCDWNDIKIEDFSIEGYTSHPSIKADMAV
jgi:thymidylate synthase